MSTHLTQKNIDLLIKVIISNNVDKFIEEHHDMQHARGKLRELLGTHMRNKPGFVLSKDGIQELQQQPEYIKLFEEAETIYFELTLEIAMVLRDFFNTVIAENEHNTLKKEAQS